MQAAYIVNFKLIARPNNRKRVASTTYKLIIFYLLKFLIKRVIDLHDHISQSSGTCYTNTSMKWFFHIMCKGEINTEE